MAYIGGKSRGAEGIIELLNSPLFDGMTYIEPFVGYCHILRRVQNKQRYIASDNHPLVVELWRGVQRGHKIPHISKEEYKRLKHAATVSFRRAVACFMYSFNGKEWGGYVYDNSKSPSFQKTGKLLVYPEQRRRYYEKLQTNEAFNRAEFSHHDYRDIVPSNCLIYCDPPYCDTTGYAGSGSFDTEEFWNIMRKWSKNNIVLVSEYAAPRDFIPVVMQEKHCTLRGRGGGDIRTECLFVHVSLKHIIEKGLPPLFNTPALGIVNAPL